MPITKITLFYADDTYEDVDANYFDKACPSVESANIKGIKEVIIYYSTGKFFRISVPISICSPKVGYTQEESPSRTKQWPDNPWKPEYPVGPWVDPSKVTD